MLALTQRNMYIQWEREEKKKLDIVTQKKQRNNTLLPGCIFWRKVWDKLHVYQHVFILLFIAVTREQVHRARIVPGYTGHSACKVQCLCSNRGVQYSLYLWTTFLEMSRRKQSNPKPVLREYIFSYIFNDWWILFSGLGNQ